MVKNCLACGHQWIFDDCKCDCTPIQRKIAGLEYSKIELEKDIENLKLKCCGECLHCDSDFEIFWED